MITEQIRDFLRWLFRRQQELPSFTVNLDDAEAKWEQEALDQWDREYRDAVGCFPQFSRLEAERIKVLSTAQQESELRRRSLLERERTYNEVLKQTYAAGSLATVAAAAQRARPNPFLPPVSNDVARYNELLKAKGIDPEFRDFGELPL